LATFLQQQGMPTTPVSPGTDFTLSRNTICGECACWNLIRHKLGHFIGMKTLFWLAPCLTPFWNLPRWITNYFVNICFTSKLWFSLLFLLWSKACNSYSLINCHLPSTCFIPYCHDDVSQCACVPTNPTNHGMLLPNNSSFIRFLCIIKWVQVYGMYTNCDSIFQHLLYYSLLITSSSLSSHWTSATTNTIQ
jgi:hypothetical protein